MISLPFSLPGFLVTHVNSTEDAFIITASSQAKSASCPHCQHISTRIHSYYQRHPQDLPVSGQTVRLILHVQRFRCLNPTCQAITFVERFPQVIASHAQRTTRQTKTLTHFAIAMSGNAASRLLKQIGMPICGETLLRLAKQRSLEPINTPTILGVDDFAFRRRATYGTLLVDLRTHRPVDLLPDRSAVALANWLTVHPGVQWISRDRSQEYARGASLGAPQAFQIVDRWHLLKNWREVLQRVVGRVHSTLKQRQTETGGTIRPRYKLSRSSSDVAASQASRQRRLRWYEDVVSLHHQGESIGGIADQLHLSPTTVRKYLAAGAFPERKYTWHGKRQIEPYIPYLLERVQQGCDHAGVLWKEIKAQGFPGGYKGVNAWLREYFGEPGRKSSEREIARKQRFLPFSQEASAISPPQDASHGVLAPNENTSQEILLEEPLGSPLQLSWLLLQDQTTLNHQEQQMLAFILQEPVLSLASTLARQFIDMIRNRQPEQFDPWLEACLACGIPDIETFAEGLQKEYQPVKAALTFPYSNGPVEGHVNKLKYIKRSMFGRGSFELLRQRVLKAA